MSLFSGVSDYFQTMNEGMHLEIGELLRQKAIFNWLERGADSMDIQGIEGMTAEQINYELQRGGKFVIYQFCISFIILTYKRGSDIYFIPAGESAFLKGLRYTLLSLFFGWWGIPWGPIYTIGSVILNCAGGKNVTQEVIQSFNAPVREEQQAI